MRVADATGYRSLLDSLNMLNERLEQAAREVSSGKRLTRPQDSPSESAEVVRLAARMDQIDQYRSNVDNGGFFLRVTESALDMVHNLATTVFERGSAAANSFNDAGVLQTLAAEIRSLRDEMLSLANTQVRGRHIFAGSRVTSPAFAVAGDTVSYQGDGLVNTIRIADGLEVRQNITGDTAFGDLFARIEELLSAIGGGDPAAIRTALNSFGATFSALGQVRTRLGVDLGKLQDSELQLQVQRTDILTRKAHIEDADMAEAITRLNQARTALEATLKAGALVRQRNLFDYLG